jgi:hypothetical protein
MHVNGAHHLLRPQVSVRSQRGNVGGLGFKIVAERPVRVKLVLPFGRDAHPSCWVGSPRGATQNRRRLARWRRCWSPGRRLNALTFSLWSSGLVAAQLPNGGAVNGTPCCDWTQVPGGRNRWREAQIEQLLVSLTGLRRTDRGSRRRQLPAGHLAGRDRETERGLASLCIRPT